MENRAKVIKQKYTTAKAKLPSWARNLQVDDDPRLPVKTLENLKQAVRDEITMYLRGLNPLTDKQYAQLREWQDWAGRSL